MEKNPNISTTNEKQLNQVGIGHTKLAHGYLMEKGDPPICKPCGTTIIIKHLFEECRMYERKREEL